MERIKSNGQSLVIADYGQVIPGNSMHDPTTTSEVGMFMGSNFDEVNRQLAELEGIPLFSVHEAHRVLGALYRYVHYKATDDLVDAYQVEAKALQAEKDRTGQQLLQRALDQFHQINPVFKLLESHGYRIVTSRNTLSMDERFAVSQHFQISVVAGEFGTIALASCGVEAIVMPSGEVEIKITRLKIAY